MMLVFMEYLLDIPGILPSYTESHQSIWDQRQMQFDDLVHALDVMGHTATVPSPAEKLLLVWLLENCSLHFDYQTQVRLILLHPCVCLEI